MYFCIFSDVLCHVMRVELCSLLLSIDLQCPSCGGVNGYSPGANVGLLRAAGLLLYRRQERLLNQIVRRNARVLVNPYSILMCPGPRVDSCTSATG